ncbi:regulatory protein, FmdB family [Oceanococcus atlanticus]|uniref:Regulatory protein, FmdB family n=1 Tax=Oceanococcus atlanticus TaxID=1317117 RepID=A0A1Y1SDD6_9GAMM|nr:zinc ribbon domain-containing protein [Oceanococcus atlanticus]ORE86325.1 regulatory protein, FmdB family [Oceanococcus atlanticus]RZO83405.1 MAG: zinc ribbon domain-containing protein [Oceanococcus sp.]
MPIYEYRCTACEHELEALQKISDAPLTHCPACDSENLVKKVSAAAFRLKGGGWYETDFKKDGKRNLAGDAGKPAASSSDSASSSASSKASDAA